MRRLDVRLFGPFQVTLDGEAVTGFRSDKVRALLAYLCTETAGPHRREKLAGMLWPDWPETSARANLRRALADLRSTISDHGAMPPFLSVTSQTIEFNKASDAWIDVVAFADLAGSGARRSVAEPSALEQAVTLYRGEFLEGFSLPDSPLFEEWVVFSRERWHRLALEVLQRLVQHYKQSGDYGHGLGHAWRRVELDPWREEAHQQLMLLLAVSGQRSAALAQYKTCRQILADELGIEPSPGMTALYNKIRDGTLTAEPVTKPAKPPTFLTDQRAPALPPIFVGREAELVRLENYLSAALGGQGQVAFVVGGPGRGKTALLHEFARWAMDAYPELLLATGAGGAYAGVGDPYLPFREVLAMLSGEVEGHWAAGTLTTKQARRIWAAFPEVGAVLAERGSGLVGTLLSGRELLARARAATPSGAGWLERLARLAERDKPARGLEQSQLFEQYANVLLEVSARHPLLIILDDLQWADLASISLLFHLGHRLEQGPILLAGAYRPHELAPGQDGRRHPLEPVLAELRTRFGNAWFDLAAADETEGRQFVDQYLDTEPNRLAEDFRDALFRRTGGHALFTIELLRAMQERGDLVQDDVGYWFEGKQLKWEALPARAEAVIAERIARLPEGLRQLLVVGSVEGEEFTAQVVARVQKMDEIQVLRVLSRELAGRHRLVRDQGEVRLNGQTLSRYRFAHYLFQQHLYQGLGEGERRLLHHRVGEALEHLYAGRVAEVAVQLAHHFADERERERRYLQLAGEQAAAKYANEEAVGYLSQALDLTPEDETAERCAVLLIREKVYDVLGRRKAQKQDQVDLWNLAVALNDQRRQAEVALRQVSHAEATGDYSAGKVFAQRAIGIAQKAGDVRGEAEGYLRWGRLLLLEGDSQGSRTMVQKALAMAKRAGLRQVEAESLICLGNIFYRTFRNQDDISEARQSYERARCIYREFDDRRGEGQSLHCIADTLTLQGDLAEAGVQYGEALSIARDIGDRRLESVTLIDIGTILRYQRDYAQARACIKQALHISRETGDRRLEGAALMELGAILLGQGDYAEAAASYRETLPVYLEIGHPLGEAWASDQLGYALLHQGAYSEARKHCQRALAIRREVGNRSGESGVLTRLGMISRNMGDHNGAQVLFEQALDIMHDTGDQSSESWVLCERALLLHQMGDDESARDLCQQALLVIQDLDIQHGLSLADARALALTFMGHALAGLGFLQEASDAYSQALTLRRELGQPCLATEPLAGLARLSLAIGDIIQSQAYTEEILDLLVSSRLEGTAEPFRVYLTCYRVLAMAGDLRASEILTQGYAELQRWANCIPDEDQRRSFLHNVAQNRELVRAWEAAQLGVSPDTELV